MLKYIFKKRKTNKWLKKECHWLNTNYEKNINSSHNRTQLTNHVRHKIIAKKQNL